MFRIAITGHRHLLEPSEVRDSIKHSLAYFKTRYEDIEALSALAVGADTIFVEEAFKQDIPVKYFLPFPVSEYQNDFDPESLTRFRELLSQNNSLPLVVNQLIPRDQAERNKAYLEVGKHMVNEADILLAVWDGQQSAGEGGTGEIVAYARQRGKNVHIIRGLKVQSLQEADEILFNQLDTAAIRYKEKFFQPAWYLGLVLAIVGVIFFAIGLAFEGLDAQAKLNLAGFEVLCIVLSAILIIYVARPFKDRFLDNRRNAEFLRTIRWFKQANIPLPLIDINLVSKSAETRRKPIAISAEIIDLEREIAGLQANPADFDDSKRKLWIFTENQIDYHERKRLKPLQTKEKLIHRILYGLTLIFYLSIGFKTVIEILHFLHEQKWHLLHLPIAPDPLLPYFNVLLIVVPSIFAVLENVRAFEEWERNRGEAEKMKGELLEMQNWIFAADDFRSLANTSRNLRFILEKENVEWTDRVASLTPGVHI